MNSRSSEHNPRHALGTSWKVKVAPFVQLLTPVMETSLLSRDRTVPLSITLQLRSRKYKTRNRAGLEMAVQDSLTFTIHKTHPKAHLHHSPTLHIYLPSPPGIRLPPHLWRRCRRQVWPNKPNPQRQQCRHLRRLLVRQQQHAKLRQGLLGVVLPRGQMEH
jgi:hypothetical protein